MKQFDLVGSKSLRLDGQQYAQFIGVIQKIVNDTYNVCIITSYHKNEPAWFVGDTISLNRNEFISADKLLFPTHIPGHTVLCRGNASDDGKERGTKITELVRFNKLIEHLRNTVDTNNPTNMPDEIINFIKTSNYSERFFLQGAYKKTI
jgi:hypothetical protein